APGTCQQWTPFGNRITDNTITGTCLEKLAGPGESAYPFTFGAIHVAIDSSGPLALDNNHLTNSQCRHAISIWNPRDASVRALTVDIKNGDYQSGTKAATKAEDSIACGAVEIQGSNRRVVIADEASFTNQDSVQIPKACVRDSGQLVIDDTPADPFKS